MTVRGGLVVCVLTAAAVCGCSTSGSSVQLSVTPAEALYDTPFATTVTGLTPRQKVTLRLTSTDKAGTVWSSSAQFTASDSGQLSTTQAPDSGAYSAADPMGLVEMLTPGQGGQEFSSPTPWTMTLSVVADDKTMAQATLTRDLPTAVTATDVRPDSSGVYGKLFQPATTSASPQPAIVVIGGSEGGLSTTFEAETLAAHGYPALALAYFNVPGLPQHLERIPLEYFATAAKLLAGQPGVDPKAVVLMGTSRGSEAALLTATHYPDLVHAVIGSVPGYAAVGGLPDYATPAWTFNGQPVPTVTGLDTVTPAPDSPMAIPVEQIDGPLLLVCGGKDQVWPSCLNAEAIRTRLQAKGSTRIPTVLKYPEAGHFVGVLLPYAPSTIINSTTASGMSATSGGTYQADQAGRADAWPKVLSFLQNLPR